MFALPGVEERDSGISVAGARALWLADATADPGSGAFLVGNEFAHLHPAPDLSLHLTLRTPDAEQAIARGWAAWHPYVALGRLPRTVVMVFAPRDRAEARVVERLVGASWEFARASADLTTSTEERKGNDAGR